MVVTLNWEMHAYIQKKEKKSFASKPSTCPWLEKEGSLLSLRSDKGLGGARPGFGSTTASFGTAEGAWLPGETAGVGRGRGMAMFQKEYIKPSIVGFSQNHIDTNIPLDNSFIVWRSRVLLAAGKKSYKGIVATSNKLGEEQ
nr:hypothetical protein Iba_chr12bCG2350 [Ipomoea batatas]